MSHSTGGGGGGHGGGAHHGGHQGQMGGHPDQSPSWNTAVSSIGEKLKGKPLTLQNMPKQTLLPVIVALGVFVVLAIPYVINWNDIEPGREEENRKAEEANQRAYGSALPGTAAGQDAHIQALQQAVMQAPGQMGGYGQAQLQAQQAQAQQYGQAMQGQGMAQPMAGQMPGQSYAQPAHIYIQPQGYAQQQQAYAPQYAPQAYPQQQGYGAQQAYAPQPYGQPGYAQQTAAAPSKFKVFVSR